MSPPGEVAPTIDHWQNGATRVESGRFRAKGCRHSGTGGDCHAIDFADAVAVADSVLYEGCRPYPHLATATEGRVRRPVGVLVPRAFVDSQAAPSRVEGPPVRPDSWWNQTECLLEADLDARMEVRLRYLQVAGEVARREATVAFTLEDLVGSGIVVTVDGGELLQARFLVSASRPPSPFEVFRIAVRAENAVRLYPRDAVMSPDEVLRRSLVSAHLLLGVGHGAFLSSIDPPEWARAAARSCRNVGLIPVLAGRWGSGSVVLSAPINLGDHPRLAAVPSSLASGL